MRKETVRRADGRNITYYTAGGMDAAPATQEGEPAVLVTGGAGYVGGSLVRMLVGAGQRVVILDDLSTGHADAVPEGVELVVAQVGDVVTLREVLARFTFRAVFHFAASSLVGASLADPLAYYRNNVRQGLALITEVIRAGCPPLILSSSAAVYGVPSLVPVPEDAALAPISPYGETKRVLEQALRWCGEAYGLRWAALRYFNAAGALEGGPTERHAPETHLIPNVLRAARGETELTLFGTDFPTPDGTAVRDYIHVADLAAGHVAALEHLEQGGAGGPFNLGTGRGHSVAEVLQAAERVVGHPIPYTTGPRRAGDPPALVADPTRAQEILGWTARHQDLGEIVASAWVAGRSA